MFLDTRKTSNTQGAVPSNAHPRMVKPMVKGSVGSVRPPYSKSYMVYIRPQV
jgi:hypothetical protein